MVDGSGVRTEPSLFCLILLNRLAATMAAELADSSAVIRAFADAAPRWATCALRPR